MSKFSPLELRKRLYDEITPSLRWNGSDNLSCHKEKCRLKLKELLGWDSFKECEHNLQITSEDIINGYKCIHFIVQTEQGYYANCHFFMPEKFDGRLPLCVGLQGHVSGAHLSLGIQAPSSPPLNICRACNRSMARRPPRRCPLHRGIRYRSPSF